MLHVLIRGVENERMRRRLFETENLDLEKAVTVSSYASHCSRHAVFGGKDRVGGKK